MANELFRFNISLAGREQISGSAEIDNYGELKLYVTDKDRPFLLEVVMTCKIKKVTMNFEIEQSRPWIEPSAEVREILLAQQEKDEQPEA